jgi:uncharacterized protein (UPF0332 family)
MDEATLKEVSLYLENAHESLAVARLNLDNDFHSAAISRAYYAIFYAANALLSSRKIARSKHSGVLGAFRQHFVKTGEFSAELSEIYGRVMEDRHESDYELSDFLSRQEAEEDLASAEKFVGQVESWLKKEGWM